MKAERLKKIPPYLFMELRKKIARARAAGKTSSASPSAIRRATPDPSSMSSAAHRPSEPSLPDR